MRHDTRNRVRCRARYQASEASLRANEASLRTSESSLRAVSRVSSPATRGPTTQKAAVKSAKRDATIDFAKRQIVHDCDPVAQLQIRVMSHYPASTAISFSESRQRRHKLAVENVDGDRDRDDDDDEGGGGGGGGGGGQRAKQPHGRSSPTGGGGSSEAEKVDRVRSSAHVADQGRGKDGDGDGRRLDEEKVARPRSMLPPPTAIPTPRSAEAAAAEAAAATTLRETPRPRRRRPPRDPSKSERRTDSGPRMAHPVLRVVDLVYCRDVATGSLWIKADMLNVAMASDLANSYSRIVVPLLRDAPDAVQKMRMRPTSRGLPCYSCQVAWYIRATRSALNRVCGVRRNCMPERHAPIRDLRLLLGIDAPDASDAAVKKEAVSVEAPKENKDGRHDRREGKSKIAGGRGGPRRQESSGDARGGGGDCGGGGGDCGDGDDDDVLNDELGIAPSAVAVVDHADTVLPLKRRVRDDGGDGGGGGGGDGRGDSETDGDGTRPKKGLRTDAGSRRRRRSPSV